MVVDLICQEIKNIISLNHFTQNIFIFFQQTFMFTEAHTTDILFKLFIFM